MADWKMRELRELKKLQMPRIINFVMSHDYLNKLVWLCWSNWLYFSISHPPEDKTNFCLLMCSLPIFKPFISPKHHTQERRWKVWLCRVYSRSEDHSVYDGKGLCGYFRRWGESRRNHCWSWASFRSVSFGVVLAVTMRLVTLLYY